MEGVCTTCDATFCVLFQGHDCSCCPVYQFAKAQTLFHSKLAKMSKKKRKNILGRALEKGQKSMQDQMKKKRDASNVSRPDWHVHQ